MIRFKEWLEEQSYLDIGHGFSGTDINLSRIWIWTKGKNNLEVKKGGKRIAHYNSFDKFRWDWQGRFESETNFVSIIYVGEGSADRKYRVPDEIKKALQKRFGKNIIFKVLGRTRL